MQVMKKYSEFTYWFELVGEDTYKVTRTSDGAVISEGFMPLEIDSTISENEVKLEWNMWFEDRPESFVGYYIKSCEQDDLEAIYDKLLLGCALIRAKKNMKDEWCDEAEEKVVNRIRRCLTWLHNTDFYTCPASSRFHEAYPSGLLHHTLKVVTGIYDLLLKGCCFEGEVNLEDAVLVALVHDWCKIGLYTSYMKNVKDEQTGTWNKVPAYKHTDNLPFPMGHGELSLYLASKFFNLSLEESLAIRWHMGAWYVVDSEHDHLQYSNENYPMVLLLQFADQLSITNYANTGFNIVKKPEN